jgi:hypothetical protein
MEKIMRTQLKSTGSTNYAQLVMHEIISMDNKLDDEFKDTEQQNIIIDGFLNQKLQRKQKERVPYLLTYENTKNMSEEDVYKCFSKKTTEEKNHITFMITVSNNFSKNDFANNAIFEEARIITDFYERIEFSLGLALEKENFLLGVPGLHDVMIMSDEWIKFKNAGGENGASQGIFMNEQHKARYKHGKTIKYNETLLSHEEATDFLITMLSLAKENLEDAKGSVFEKKYETAVDRYSDIYETYKKELTKFL